MANSKTFLLLGLAFAVVLLISSHVSAREVAEAAQTQENMQTQAMENMRTQAMEHMQTQAGHHGPRRGHHGPRRGHHGPGHGHHHHPGHGHSAAGETQPETETNHQN